jgi:two-component system, LytTR family, sensor kinase
MRFSGLLKRKFLIFYLILWVVTSFLYGSLLSWHFGWGSSAAWTDAMLSMGLLFVVFAAQWYVIRFGKSKAVLSYRSLTNVFISGVFLLSSWYFLSQHMLAYVFSQQSDYLAFVSDWRVPRLVSGMAVALIICLFMLLLSVVEETKEAGRREKELKAMIQQTELQALKNQLNPHFLYNSLNAVSSLIGTNPGAAREMVIRLSDFLRYSLKQDAMHLTTLKEELQSIQQYMEIESVRFGEKLSYTFEVEKDQLSTKLPAMILQPLFENAVKHGVQQSDMPVAILLKSRVSENMLILSVSNRYDKQIRFRGEGIGLQNVRNRLRLIYGNGQLLSIQDKEQVFTASLSLPLEQSVSDSRG